MLSFCKKSASEGEIETASLGIAFPASMIETKPAGKQNYRFQKIFSEGDFLAGGLLEIPVNEKKPLKPARDNSYVSFLPVSI